MVDIQTKFEDGIYWIVVEGDIDASSSIYLDESIKKAFDQHSKKILVDCAALNYISSAGLGVFMSYIEDIENHNVQFVLFGLQEKVKHIFQILGLDQLLKITEDVEEAKHLVNGLQA